MKHLLIFIFILYVSYIDGRCKTAGWNPYWNGPPRIKQTSLTSVRLSWEGLLQNSECADLLRVKYWKVSDPNNYKTSDKFEVDTTSWEVKGLRKFQNYAFQVIAIEDTVWYDNTVDYNRSPKVYYATRSNPDPLQVNSHSHSFSINDGLSKTLNSPLKPRIDVVQEEPRDREPRAFYDDDDDYDNDRKSLPSRKSNVSKLVEDNFILVIAGAVLGGLIVLVVIVVLVVSMVRRITRPNDKKVVSKLDSVDTSTIDDSTQLDNIDEERKERKLKSQFVPGTRISKREQKALSLILNQYK